MPGSGDIATASKGFHFICRVNKDSNFLTIWSGGDSGLVPGFCKLFGWRKKRRGAEADHEDREVHEGGETYLRYMGRRKTSTIFRAIK